MNHADVSLLFKNLPDLPVKASQMHHDRYDVRVELAMVNDRIIGFLFKGIKASSAEEARQSGCELKQILCEGGQRVWRVFSLLAPAKSIVCALDETLTMMNDMDGNSMSREEFWNIIERMGAIYFFEATRHNIGVWQYEMPIIRVEAKYYRNRPESPDLEKVIPVNVSIHLF